MARGGTAWAVRVGLGALLVFAIGGRGRETATVGEAYGSGGGLTGNTFFPLAVWLQDPANAPRYREAGFNTFVGLWKGPTEEQLAALAAAGMKLVCAQNETALRHRHDPLILAWMHEDEPDNAQSLGEGRGYGPPIPPDRVVTEYQRMRAVDPSRPVLLNFGQGVAWDDWIGRGVRRRHPEDYAKYLEGCDIASFDIYPVVHEDPAVSGKLWWVARGVERLVAWSRGGKVIWNCLECTRIGNPDRKPTPHEVRAEAWMSLIHGSRGLIYFVHQFKPVFREAALLDDPEMVASVAALNRQITRLAPVLNRPGWGGRVKVTTDHPETPVAVLVRPDEGMIYLFAVGMRPVPARAVFEVEGLTPGATVEVVDEGRKLTAGAGTFEDQFEPWDAHIYRLAVRQGGGS